MIRSPYILVFLAAQWLSLPLSASILDDIEYELSVEQKEKPIYKSVKAIVLISDKKHLLSYNSIKNFEGIQVLDVDVPGGAEKLERRLKRYCSKPLGQKEILSLVNGISRYYKDQQHPFVIVEIPKQDISSDVLQIVIKESRLGEIKVQGGRPSKGQRVIKYVDLKPGEVIDEKSLLKDLQFMNRNPFRRVDYIYSPGEKEHTTDLTLYVEDRRSARFYVGGDNTGVDTTGRQRWFAGINLGYLFNWDQNLSYQYTASNDFHQFQAHTLMYLLFLPWRHVLDIYGGYSSVHADLSFPGSKSHGESSQASLRYIIPLNPTRALNHEVGWGFDFKRTNNEIEFSETFPKIGKFVNLTQLTGKYAGNYEGSFYRIDYDMEIFWSPGQWLSDQSNFDFQSLRSGAKNHWVYARSFLTYSLKLPHKFWIFSKVRGQVSGSNLLPSEQLGIGGFDTVRGYEERQLNMDSGAIVNVEFRTPSFFQRRKSGTEKDGLQFLGFFDWGYGGNHTPIPGERDHDFLMGAGPGVRYTYNNIIAGRLDWGFKLHKEPRFGGGGNMLHFQLVLSY